MATLEPGQRDIVEVPATSSAKSDRFRSELSKAQREREKLPVREYLDHIVDTVRQNSATVLCGETGSGKTTEVSHALMDAGYDVISTQPRVIAARSLSEYVAEINNCEHGKEIGYRTGRESKAGRDTRLTFCTDAWALVHEIHNDPERPRVILVDEVHERNKHQDILLALVKQKIKDGANIKLVICSATMDTTEIQEYASDLPHLAADKAPVVEVPGRLFPIQEIDNIEPGADEISASIANSDALARAGERVLTILPGKATIERAKEELEKAGHEVRVLHGEIPPDKQRQALREPKGSCIVLATNIVQTSITVPWITAVVDSGLQNINMEINGVDGIHEVEISQQDSIQRKGRAGRCQPGKYVYCGRTPRKELPTRTKPEILRTRLDQEILRLLDQGIDIESLELLSPPSHEAIQAAKESLSILGLIDEKQQVTDLGREVVKYPVSVQFGRMLAEADRLGVLEEAIPLIAVMQQEGVGRRKRKDEFAAPWKKLINDEDQSDVFAQYKLYMMGRELSTKDQYEKGILPKAMREVAAIDRDIRQQIGIPFRGLTELNAEQKLKLRKVICAGMLENLYERNGSQLSSPTDVGRRIGFDSVLDKKPANSRFVVAIPRDIKKRDSFRTIKIASFVTEVDIDWLPEIAPHLFKEEVTDANYDSKSGKFTITLNKSIAGVDTGQSESSDPSHPLYFQGIKLWIAKATRGEQLPALSSNEPDILTAIREVHVVLGMLRSTETMGWSSYAPKHERERESLKEILNRAEEFHSLDEVPPALIEDLTSYCRTIQITYPELLNAPRARIGSSLIRLDVDRKNGEYVTKFSATLREDSIRPSDIEALSAQDHSQLLHPSGETIEFRLEKTRFNASNLGEFLAGYYANEDAFFELNSTPPYRMDEYLSSFVDIEPMELSLKVHRRMADGETAASVEESLLVECRKKEIPEIERHFVGRASDGREVSQYGTLCVDHSSMGSRTLRFKWFTDKERAEHERASLQKHVERETRERIRAHIDTVESKRAHEKWVAESGQRQELIEQGKALDAFSAERRGKGQLTLEATFVLDKDGKLVSPNFSRKDNSSGAFVETWNYVGPDSLVFRLERSSVEGKTSVKAVKHPEEGINEQQRRLLDKMASSYKIPHSMLQFEKEEIAYDHLLPDLKRELAACPLTLHPIEWNDTALEQLVSAEGLSILNTQDNSEHFAQIYAEINFMSNGRPSGSDWRRNHKAQEIYSEDIGDGTVSIFLVIQDTPNQENDHRTEVVLRYFPKE